MQKKTFTNWVNEKLNGTPYKVEVLEKDLDDGVTLIKLLETLANKKMHKRYYYSQHTTPLPQQFLMPCRTKHQSLQCFTTASHPIAYIHLSINFMCLLYCLTCISLLPLSALFSVLLCLMFLTLFFSPMLYSNLSDIMLSLSTSSTRGKMFR